MYFLWLRVGTGNTLKWAGFEHVGDKLAGPKDSRRVADGWGLWSDEMRPHWQRVRDGWRARDFADLQHSTINILTEWCRLDSQRAAKVLIWRTVNAMLGWGVAAVLAWKLWA